MKTTISICDKHDNKENYNKFIKLINNNINEIRQFILNNFDNCKTVKNINKIEINCPYCDDNRNRHKMIINLDWGNFRCYRCHEYGSLIKLMKIFNLYDSFINLLSSLNNISIYNLKTMFRNNNSDYTFIPEEENDELELNINDINIKNFINKNALVSVFDIKQAKEYALKRVYNNINEIESYLADDKYIYIPIIMNDITIAYMGRLYMKYDNYPRYLMNVLSEKEPAIIGFYDEVVDNISTNSIYLTEGYFDSYAINYAMSNYVSMCMFGKNKGKTVADFISNKFSPNTRIYITLDSKKKDDKIYSSNKVLGEYLKKYFPYLYVIELSNEDPSDILDKYGVFKLKEELNKATPYLKYIINKSITKTR